MQVLGLVMPTTLMGPSFPYVFTAVHILAVSHTCMNPFIYCWMNRRVRYGFMDIAGKARVYYIASKLFVPFWAMLFEIVKNDNVFSTQLKGLYHVMA